MLDTTEMSNENEATSEEEKLLREEDSNESIVSSIKDFGETVFLVRKYMLLRQKQYQLDIHVLCMLRFQVINCSAKFTEQTTENYVKVNGISGVVWSVHNKKMVYKNRVSRKE